MLLKHKTSIITGCSRGIGLEVLKIFAENGSDIFACYRKLNDKIKKDCKDLSNKFNTNIHPVAFDLEDSDQIKLATEEILKKSEKINILVNNSGIIDTSLFQMTKVEDFKKIFDINYFSYVNFIQRLLKNMSKTKSGSIVNISSSAAHEGNVGRSAYASSKSAFETMSKVMSRELGRYNIRVNSIAPGLTDTEMMKSSTPKKFLDETIARLSLNRVAQPKEIANVILFLASDLSSYITGQTIRVDGGM